MKILNSETRFTLTILLMALLSISSARAATISAASCSKADVQAAITSASSGDTVNVPAGTCSWSGEIMLQNKSVNIIGAGAGSTVINGGGFSLNTSASRISGFKFNDPHFDFVSAIGWRVDNNIISLSSCGEWAQALGTKNHPVEGLIDHNQITNGRLVYYGEPYDPGNGGNTLWASPSGLGTSKFIYLEDNTITFPDGSCSGWLNFVDGNLGCRIAARYNSISGTRFEIHGVQGTNTRACMAWEIYNNTMVNPPTPSYRPFFIRGGTGMIFHNTSDGRFRSNSIDIDNNRSHSDQTGFGWCDGTSAIDGNTPGGEGYPCRDQIGRSTDVFLWNFGSPYPAQAFVPAYIWKNTQPLGEIPVKINCVGTTAQCTRQSTKQIVLNRDYYTYSTSFDGTSGVGEGTLANRPSTCTTGVAYWATDQGDWNSKNPGPDGQLYKCTATNSWSIYYTPYTYPHPLQQTGNPQALPAPSGLRIVP